MRTGKTSAATLGLVGGLALGVWIGSEVTSSRADVTPQPAASPRRPLTEPAAPTAPAKPKRVTRVSTRRRFERRRRGAGTGIGSQTGDDDSGVGA